MPDRPNAFSLADPPTVTELLQNSGFVDVAFTDVNEAVYYGPDVTTALDWICGFTTTRDILEPLDTSPRPRGRAAARDLAAHRPTTASGSIRAPGSSPLVATEGGPQHGVCGERHMSLLLFLQQREHSRVSRRRRRGTGT